MEKEVLVEDALATSGAKEAITIHVNIMEVIDMSMMDKILIPVPVLNLIKDFIAVTIIFPPNHTCYVAILPLIV